MNKNEVDLENVEFNNPEEDKKIIESENTKIVSNNSDNNKDNKNKNIIIISVIIGILVLIIIILSILLLSSKDNNNSKEKEENKENNTPGVVKSYDVNVSGSHLLLNKYILINEKSETVVVDLNGKVIDKISKNEKETVDYYINNKEVYLIKSSNKEKTIYKIINDKIVKFYSLNGNNNGFIKNDSGNIIGSFDDFDNNEQLYFIDKDSYSTLNLNNYIITSKDYSSDSKNIYNDKYAIIVSSDEFGIYYVKQEKELIAPSYKKIEYLNKNYFAAKKDNKYGIVDIDNKVILDFDYDNINYYDNYYFLIYNDSLKILDNNFVELKSVDNINNSLNRIKISSFKDKIVYLANKALIIDKTGNINEFDFDDFYVYGNYLITSKSNSTIVTLYKSNLEILGEYDTKTTDNHVEKSAFYFDDLLILNGGQFFDVGTKTNKGNINKFRKTSQDYQVLYESNQDGKVTISYKDEEIGVVTKVKLMDFLTSSNNGITITKEHFIFSAGDVHFIAKR